jgi:hypothetical protein
MSIATSTLSKNTLKIVNASNVRIRSAPSTSAKIIDKLSFGAVVKVDRRTKNKAKIAKENDYWYYLSEHKAWIFGTLLTDFQPNKVESIQYKLVQTRLKKSLKFKEYVNLSKYIKQLLPETKNADVKGGLELSYLICLEKASEKIKWGDEKKLPYISFIEENKDKILYAEIAGQYIVNPDLYWDLSKTYTKNNVGDEIMWYAVNAMSGGECEGMTYCMIMRGLGNEGKYLRHYPVGKYSKIALKNLSLDYQYVIDNNFGKNSEAYTVREKEALRKEEKRLYRALKKMDKNMPQVKRFYKQLKVFNKLFYR